MEIKCGTIDAAIRYYVTTCNTFKFLEMIDAKLLIKYRLPRLTSA